MLVVNMIQIPCFEWIFRGSGGGEMELLGQEDFDVFP